MQQQPGHQAPQQPVRAQAQPPVGSNAQPGDSEIIFEGVARATSVYSGYLKWFGVSILGGAAAYGLGLIEVFSTWPLWILGFIGIPGMLWTFFRYRTTRYKITNRRLEHEHGVLTTTVDSIELWRVLDVRYSQNIIDRMFGNATVTLIGTDQTDPEFELYGLPNARKLFEDLREAVQAARHTSRPMEMVGADGMMENMMEHQ